MKAYLNAIPNVVIILTINNRNDVTRKRNNHFEILGINVPHVVSILIDITSIQARPKDRHGTTIVELFLEAILLVRRSFRIIDSYRSSSATFYSPFGFSSPPFWSKFFQSNNIARQDSKPRQLFVLNKVKNIQSKLLLRKFETVLGCRRYTNVFSCIQKCQSFEGVL